jgi:hypothetical protein
MNKFLGVLLFFLFASAQAALIDRGQGFIYDDVLDVTWAKNANINGEMDWFTAVDWADDYSQTHSVYGTFDDWRLADMDVNGDGTIRNCSTAAELNCRDNELGYLFYQNGITSSAPGLFINVQSSDYWSGTELASVTTFAWYISFVNGFQHDDNKANQIHYALAVRSGDVAAVPVPAAVWLFGSGLGLLGWLRRKQTA